MARHVVDHEPGLALFVLDEDPLVFYTALSELALKSLNDGGSLIAECHFENN
jgi:release factor glutamine methyltransferase